VLKKKINLKGMCEINKAIKLSIMEKNGKIYIEKSIDIMPTI